MHWNHSVDTFLYLAHVGEIVQINPQDRQNVYVVGDTHGQVHDVVKMLNHIGAYKGSDVIVFNGASFACSNTTQGVRLAQLALSSSGPPIDYCWTT